MIHARNAHQDCEAAVIKANRKHQIILNLEVKRIEMEKKMRERYFCFERSLISARRLKIVDRQKSLGIYRPQTMNGKEKREGTQVTSFFFTAQPVAMDSKARLPSLFPDSQTHPRLPTKLLENSKMLQFLTHKNRNELIMDKEKAKRIAKRTMGARDKERENDQLKAQLLMKQDLQKRDARKTVYQDGGNDVDQGATYRSPQRPLGQNEVEQNQLDTAILLNKGDEHDNKREGVSSKEKAKERKQNMSHSKPSSPVQSSTKENQVIETSNEKTNSENTAKKLPLIDPICPENTSTRAQSSNFTAVQELQTWRKNLETSCFNPCDNLKGLARAKSVTGYRIDSEMCTFKVRPQTSFAI